MTWLNWDLKMKMLHSILHAVCMVIIVIKYTLRTQ